MPLLLTYIALTLAACSTEAAARPVLWTCNMTFDATGHQTRREVSINAANGVVRDNDFTWMKGTKSQGKSPSEQWVDIDGTVMRWGNRVSGRDRPTSTFQLDLRTGRYSLTSANNGRVSHGACSTADMVG